jgi:D-alanyl-D-alanine carboxypeptidase/D-alanyl-D-alanine-endopeptidase (penicillin-binding protein 4)
MMVFIFNKNIVQRLSVNNIKIFFLFLLFSLQLFSGTLPYDLRERLSAYPLNKNNYSILIQSTHDSRPLASWHAHKKRSPASVIKLLTTYASLVDLGYNYRWETKFYHTGSIQRGVLRGDLVVRASGDPTLKTKDIEEIVSKLRARGIRRITGNIIIDKSIYRISSRNNSGFDKNRYSPYNAMPDALMFNQRKSTVCVAPHGRRIYINKDVPDLSYKVINRLKVVNGSCRGSRAWPKLTIRKNTMIFSGKLSKHCPDRKVCKVITKPHLSFYYTLKKRMQKRGIKFSGRLKLKKTPRSAKYLFSHQSKTLEEIISVTAKKSNNLFARQLMLTLGVKEFGKPGTLQKGRRGIEKILNRHHILEKGTTFIENGSGLSRVSKITARSLGNLLLDAERNYGQRWMNTLSIAGIDGTIRRRFARSTVYGRAWMKTGTIRRVANIAGYVEGASGERYVVVVLVNDKYSARYGRRLANTVIKWVADTQ